MGPGLTRLFRQRIAAHNRSHQITVLVKML
jgi:hypothetical protein